MTRTPDEIKKAMAYCVEPYCPGGKCPYWNAESCAQDKTYDALALIQQLQVELEDMTARYKIADDCAKKKGEMNEKLYAELTAVKAERDAAVADLKSYRCCHGCKHLGVGFNEPCLHCDFENNCFEWRGVQKEDGNAKSP